MSVGGVTGDKESLRRALCARARARGAETEHGERARLRRGPRHGGEFGASGARCSPEEEEEEEDEDDDEEGNDAGVNLEEEEMEGAARGSDGSDDDMDAEEEEEGSEEEEEEGSEDGDISGAFYTLVPIRPRSAW